MKKDKNKVLPLIILGLITIFSLFIRVYKIGETPPSLNWDEVSHGYNAYSIFKTGSDEWGEHLPLIFRAYGDYKLPLYIYLTVLPVALLGLGDLSIRLVSVLSGVGLVLVSYLITLRLTKNQTFSLLSAFLVAVSPWSLFVSRAALEANLAAFLFALGGYFLISWLQYSLLKNATLAVVFWGLSLYSYNSARILVPLFLFVLGILALRKKKNLKQMIIPGLLAVIFFLPVLGQILDQSGKARLDQMTLIDQGAINRIIEYRQNSKLPLLFSKLVYNRPSFFVFYSIKNYLSNFSPRYLFFRGGSHYQFSLPDHELLYLVTAPFLVIGLFAALGKGKPEEKFLLFWLLAAFIPSAITRDAPHSLRTLLILPVPMVFTSLGVKWVVEKVGKNSLFGGKPVVGVIVFGCLVSLGRWWRDYSEIYPKAYSWSWQYGNREAVEFLKESYDAYDKIFYTKRYGEPHEFVLTYFAWDPQSYQNDANKIWQYHDNWYWVDSFDKFVFVDDWLIAGVKCQGVSSKCALVTTPGNYPEGWTSVKTINFVDGKPALEILEK
ncbi:MAG: ArnT family glycosyltransferase [Patescibacteria group bacterium]|jgi:4-amino-4-deoxy-L-arabinose transferase-like glycosyltransferase